MSDFIKKYTDYAYNLTDAPIVFHNFVAYFLMSSAIQNKVYILFGDQRIYPNLWIILIALSSSFRKTTSMNIGKRLLPQSIILPSEFSQEALIELLEKKPQGSFFYSELMTLLGLLQRDYMSGAKSFLTEIYDSPNYYSRLLKNKEYILKDICINFLSATTKEWFLKNTKLDDMRAGFLPRFLFVPAFSKEKEMPIPPSADIDLQDRLREELEKYTKIDARQMELSEEARKEYHAFYVKTKKYSGDIDPFVERYKIYCLKFAMLNQINKNKTSKVIEIKAMQEAIATTNWLLSQLQKLFEDEFTFDKFQEKMQKLIKFLKSKDGEATRVDVLNYTHLSSKELDDVVRTLLEAEKIEVITEKEEKRRPKKIYRLVRNDFS